MNSLKALFIPLVITISSAALAQQDHAPAEMMAPAQAPMSEEKYAESLEEEGRQQSEASIMARFRKAFPGHGKPRIAVFWNREFPSRVSDWYSHGRGSLNVKGELSVKGGENPREEKGRGTINAEAEFRGAASTQSDRNATALGLQSGLISTFKKAGASVIDQAMAQRITDNALEDGTFERVSPDQMRLQMRALSQHADYVLELVIGSEFDDDGLYQVRVLSVKDASVVAVFSTEAKPPEDEVESVWVVGDKGYEKRERPIPVETTGRELALRTMMEMSL